MTNCLKRSTPFFVCFYLIAIFIIPRATAQTKEDLLRTYNNETIQTSGSSYIIGSKQVKFGELKSQFTSGITKDLYRKAAGQRVLGGLTSVLAIGALVTSLIVRKDNKGAAFALSSAGIGINLLSFHFRKRTSVLMDRAIWQRNKEILFGATP